MVFKSEIKEAIKEAVKELYQIDIDPVVEHPAQEEHGDYSTNVAMVLADRLEKKPLDIAEEIKDAVSKSLRTDVASPGFINFRISEEALLGEVNRINELKNSYGSSDTGKGKTVVVDYSAPNIAKRFGVGHLRSTIIGQALYNLYSFIGYKTIGDNHLGDWGTQFGVLLAEIKDSKAKVEDLTVDDLEKMYVDFHQKAEKDPQFMDKARSWFKKLEEGDKEVRRIWKAVVDVSLKEFDWVYDLLGVDIDYAYGESFYGDKMPAVISEVRERGLSKKSAGAEIVEFEDMPPTILVKSDGATTYFTRDLATIKFRIDEWDPQIIIYEVGADQTLHFRQVFETANKLSWSKDREFVHVAHGLIRFKKEGKMSTRRGQTIKLEEVLNESVSRARKLVEDSKTGKGLSSKQKDEIAKAVGVGAVKYFDLSHHPKSDIVFSWESMFLLEGNSAPYLQYTYARALSVLDKEKTDKPQATSRKPLASEAEVPLLRWLYRFPEILEEAAASYSPNLLCNYLFELAQRFNSFYADVPIIKAEGVELQRLRLAITAATAQVLKNGLGLLGIEAPERL